jgi:hypothetical protein
MGLWNVVVNILEPISRSKLQFVRTEGGSLMERYTVAESTDELLRLVSDRRRRAVLNHLRENGDGAVTVDELVDGIPADGFGSADERTARARVELQLRHVHLPKLDAAGIVEYDAGSATVRYRPGDRGGLERLLEFLSDEL